MHQSLLLKVEQILIRLIHGPTMFHNQLNSKQIYDRISGMWNMSSLVEVCTFKNTKCPSKALVAVSFSPAQNRKKILQLVSTHITFHSFMKDSSLGPPRLDIFSPISVGRELISTTFQNYKLIIVFNRKIRKMYLTLLTF